MKRTPSDIFIFNYTKFLFCVFGRGARGGTEATAAAERGKESYGRHTAKLDRGGARSTARPHLMRQAARAASASKKLTARTDFRQRLR